MALFILLHLWFFFLFLFLSSPRVLLCIPVNLHLKYFVGYCWFSKAVGDYKGPCDWGLWRGCLPFSFNLIYSCANKDFYQSGICSCLTRDMWLIWIYIFFRAQCLIINCLSCLYNFINLGIIWEEEGRTVWDGRDCFLSF